MPRRLVRPVAAASTAAEGLLAGLAGYAALSGRQELLRMALYGCVVLLAAYTSYTFLLLRGPSNRAIPCGCSGADLPMSGWVLGRAGGLMAVAAFAAALTSRAVAPADDWARFTTALLAAVAFAILAWQLPEAMLDPTNRRESTSPARSAGP